MSLLAAGIEINSADDRLTEAHPPTGPLAEAPPIRFSLRSLFVAMMVFAAMACTFTWLYKRAAENYQHDNIKNGLKYVMLGVHNYHTAREVIPAATLTDASGAPINSWRFRIWPYVEQLPRNSKFDWYAAWNAPINRQLAASKNAAYNFSNNDQDLTTNIFVVTGPGTVFDPNLANDPFEPWPHVILAIEVANSKTHWMQPGDYDVNTLLACNGQLRDCITSIMPHRVHLVFADGEVWTLTDETPMAAVKPFLTIAEAKTHNRDQLLAKYRVD